MMDNAELNRIEQDASEATPGPWKASDFGWAGNEEPSTIIVHQGKFNWNEINEGEFVVSTPAWEQQQGADAWFIANARTDVPALVAEVRKAQEVREKFKALAEDLKNKVTLLHNQYKRFRETDPERGLELLDEADKLMRQADQIEQILGKE